MATTNVPDHVIFGPDPSGNPLSYGDVRKLSVQERLGVLRRPFDPKDRADARRMNTVGDVLYTFFRNSMMHGFRGRAVFLTEVDHESKDLTLIDADGTMILRPSWLWNRYVAVVGSTFDEIVAPASARNTKRACAEQYVALMLK